MVSGWGGVGLAEGRSGGQLGGWGGVGFAVRWDGRLGGWMGTGPASRGCQLGSQEGGHA